MGTRIMSICPNTLNVQRLSWFFARNNRARAIGIVWFPSIQCCECAGIQPGSESFCYVSLFGAVHWHFLAAECLAVGLKPKGPMNCQYGEERGERLAGRGRGKAAQPK